MPAARRLLATLALGALIGLAALAVPALARRQPTSAERSAITVAVHRYVRARHSAAARDSRIRGILVSTTDRHHALVRLRSATRGPEEVLVHKGARPRGTRLGGRNSLARAKGWRVVAFAVGAFRCSAAPRRVFRDLLGSAAACAPQGY